MKIHGLGFAAALLMMGACGDDSNSSGPDAQPGEVCEVGQVECGGSCVITASDPNNCGACGTTCDTGEACVLGDCLALDACTMPSGAAGAVQVSAILNSAEEGGNTASYSLVLTAEPCTTVSIELTPDAQVSVSPSTVVFGPGAWDVPRTVTVFGVQDAVQEGLHNGVIAHAAVSGDTAYSGITIDDATVPVLDRAPLWHISLADDGSSANDSSATAAVSNDGRYIAFESAATNLVTGDAAGATDIFLRDSVAGTTKRVSNGLAAEADDDSIGPRISADGSTVTYRSAATNLVSDTISASGEIYSYNITTEVNSLVSAQCAGCNNEISPVHTVSSDGSRIAYSTRRAVDDVVDDESEYDVYLLDTTAATTTMQSINTAGENGTAFWGSNAFTPNLSSNGRFIGFNSAAQNLATPDLSVQNFHGYIRDTMSSTLTRVSLHNGGTANCDGTHRVSSSSAPAVSDDGNIAAFHSACAFTLDVAQTTDTGATQDIMVRNVTAETTTRVSVAPNGDEADGDSTLIGMSADGRYVVFNSLATNLVADDTNGRNDIFVHDRNTGTTRRVSLSAQWAEIPAGADGGALSANGQFLVFQTPTNLLPSDINASDDVYMMQLY